MTNNKTARTMKPAMILIIILVAAQGTLAITMEMPEKISAEQGEQVILMITIKGSNGTTNITRTPEIGIIQDINNTHKEFKWTATYETEETHKKIIFTAKDEANQTTTKEVIIAKPPQISLETSGGLIHEDKYKIKLETDMRATCKYDLKNKEYLEKQYTLKKDSEEKKHEGTTPPLGQGQHEIHITCKSEHGAETKTIIELEINLKPTAEIRLNPKPPLRAGIVKVEVIASEDLITTPELKYYFDDDTSPRSITLTGSGDRWEGYIVIQETDKKRIGTFLFKGIDKTNLEGTEITNGKIFIVDNSRPTQVASIKATVESHRIKLEWKYLEEETHNIKEYRVYRKKGSGGVEYINYYATTNENQYYDTNIEYGEPYYYKVSAVNHAGREGELSREVPITFLPELQETTAREGLEPTLITELNQKISRIDRILMDINSAENMLQRATGREKTDAIQDLGVLARITASKNKIQNVKSELEKLRNKSLTRQEFETATKAFTDEAENEFRNTPINIEIKDSVAYQEFSDDEKAREALEEYFSFEGLDTEDEDVKTLVREIIRIQDNFLIETTITKAEIQYPEREETASIIKKRISSQETIENPEILELIPGSIAESATDITFLERPEIIRHNPLVKWVPDRLGTKTITYYVKKDADISDLRSTKTIVLKRDFVEEKQNLITGRATQTDREESTRHPLLIPLIIGILTIILLTTYYVKYSSSEGTGRIPNIITKITDKIKDKDIKIIPKKKDDSHKKIMIDHHEENKAAEKSPEKEKREPEAKKDHIEEVKEVLGEIKNICEELHTKTVRQETKRNKKIIRAPEDKAFILKNGQKLRSLKELKEALKYIDEDTFRHHANNDKNDFSTWIQDVFKNRQLAMKIKNSKNREETIKKIKP